MFKPFRVSLAYNQTCARDRHALVAVTAIVRPQFFFGLLSFIGALALRVWCAFAGKLGSGLALLFAATGLHFTAFFNTTITNYSYGVLGLAWRYFTLLIPRLASSAIGALSLVAYGAAGGLCFQALQQGTEDAITKDA